MSLSVVLGCGVCRIIPHLGGLTKHEREKRILAAFDYVAFVDDSGNSPQDPWLILAGWIGTVPEWEYFTEDWHRVLKTAPAIDYFKLNEAAGLKKCFAGFTEQQATEKCRQLLKVIIRHNLHGAVSIISPQVHREVIQAEVPRSESGRIDRRFTNAFYLSFLDVVMSIFKIHTQENLEGKVDIVFDGKKGSGPTSRSICVYEYVKETLKNQNHPLCPIMGNITPGDDKQLKPLQAADFLAGHVRATMTLDKVTPALRAMYKQHRIYYNEMTADYLKRYLSGSL